MSLEAVLQQLPSSHTILLINFGIYTDKLNQKFQLNSEAFQATMQQNIEVP